MEATGIYGTDVATIGGIVQLVTKGINLGNMRTEDSDEELEIRVRFPEKDRLLSTIDDLKVRTTIGLVPISNLIKRKPVPKVDNIARVNKERVFDISATKCRLSSIKYSGLFGSLGTLTASVTVIFTGVVLYISPSISMVA